MNTAIIAHRGESSAAPENTLAAFALAIDAGADAVEFDVQASRDGVPVVIHDEELARTTDGQGPVGEHSLAELQALDAGGWFAPAFRGERIPTLAQVLALLRPTPLQINIELKTTICPYAGLVPAVVALVREAGLVARVVLSSFNHNSLLAAAALAPELPRAALSDTQLAAPWDYCRGHGFAAYHPERHGCDGELIARCHAAGIAVRVYTVDDPVEARRLMALGVDGLFTNSPRRLVALRTQST